MLRSLQDPEVLGMDSGMVSVGCLPGIHSLENLQPQTNCYHTESIEEGVSHQLALVISFPRGGVGDSAMAQGENLLKPFSWVAPGRLAFSGPWSLVKEMRWGTA